MANITNTLQEFYELVGHLEDKYVMTFAVHATTEGIEAIRSSADDSPLRVSVEAKQDAVGITISHGDSGYVFKLYRRFLNRDEPLSIVDDMMDVAALALPRNWGAK